MPKIRAASAVGPTLLSPTAKISLATIIPPVYTDTVSARLFDNSFVPQTSRSANETPGRSPGLLSRLLSRWDRGFAVALAAVGPKPARAWSQTIATADRLDFFHTDHLGSTRVVTDKDGNLYERIDYGPFGEIFNDDLYPPSGSGYDADDDYDRHKEKYTGQQWDYRTGLYYYGARYYDPEVGRFTSADTIVPNPLASQDYNRYTYVRNNPMKYVDPSGHFLLTFAAMLACAIIGSGIGAAIGLVVPSESGDSHRFVPIGISSFGLESGDSHRKVGTVTGLYRAV